MFDETTNNDACELGQEEYEFNRLIVSNGRIIVLSEPDAEDFDILPAIESDGMYGEM